MGLENLGYRDPGIRVYQIIANLTTAMSDVPLNPILVGACYKVVNHQELVSWRDSIQHNDNDYLVNVIYESFPGLTPGGVIQAESVMLHVTGTARIAEGVPTIFGSGTNLSNVFSSDSNNANFAPVFDSAPYSYLSAEIKVDDEIVISNSKNKTYTITKIKDNIVSLDQKINSEPEQVNTMSIYRKYEDHTIIFDVNGDIGDTKDGAITIKRLLADGRYPFVKGSIDVSYRALRKDLSGRYKISTLKELQDMMETSVDNPIGFFANQAINTSGAVDGIGKQLYLYVVTEDSSQAVQAAVNELSQYGIYYLIPVLGGGDVAKTYSNYVIARTQPDVGEFMMTMVSPVTELATEEEIG